MSKNPGLERTIDSINLVFSKDILYLKYDSARVLKLEQIIRTSDSIQYDKGVIEVAITAARICMLGFQNKKALDFLNIANNTMLKDEETRSKALVYLYFGLYNFRINNLDAALDYYLQSKKLSLEAQDSGIYARSLSYIANLYLESGYQDKAREYLAYSIVIDEKRMDFESLAIDYHRMSLYHLRKGHSDSAWQYMNLVLKASEDSKNPLLYIFNLNNIASYQISQGNLESGEQYSMKALHLLDSISFSVFPTSANSVLNANLGLIYQKRKEYIKSLHFFNLAFADSLYNIDLKYRLSLLYHLYFNHQSLGNHNTADSILSAYLSLRDNLDKSVAKQNLQDLELRYNFQQTQYENEHKNYKMRLLFYLVLITLGLGLVVLVLFIQKQRIKIKNTRLQKDIQDLKLERLNKELISKALYIAQNNERNFQLMRILREKLPDFQTENQKIVLKIIEELSNKSTDPVWKEFELRFTEVNKDFYKKLSIINPNLTVNEKRLCAFLLLDMTTKEISLITGQNIRAIEQARIRLRKQLGLTNSNVSLTAFLNAL